MKTNYLPRNKRQARTKRREILFIVILLICATVGASYFGTYFSGLIAPLWRSNMVARIGVKNFVGSLRDKDMLVEENTVLKERLAADEELIVSLRTIASAHDELLKTFGRTRPLGIAASVLVHPPETPYDILVLDAGENLSVLPGTLVTTAGGIALGVITDVFTTISRVRLYSTAGERTDAVLERDGLVVTLVGRGGGNLEFTVPRDTIVQIGDRVLLPNLDTSLLGVVGSVEVTPTDSFKSVLVRSPVSPMGQRFVIIRQ